LSTLSNENRSSYIYGSNILDQLFRGSFYLGLKSVGHLDTTHSTAGSFPNILIKTKTNMPATTKRQKTAHATHLPTGVFTHILSYCEDPMILHKRQHARVWRTISVCTNGWRCKIWATVNGERKTGMLILGGYMREHTNYAICHKCERCIMHTPDLDCPDCEPWFVEMWAISGLP
jgi:hypothetical protein